MSCYKFPKSYELKTRLKDVLEPRVDEKYYLSEEIQKRFVYKPRKNEIQVEGDLEQPQWIEQSRRVYNQEGLCPTIPARAGGMDITPKILIKNATKQGYLEATDGDGIDLNYPDSETRRGRVQPQQAHTLTTSGEYGVIEFPVIAASRGRNPENPSDRTIGAPTEQRLEINKKGVSNTLTSVQKDNYVVEQDFKIRKLTPLECWRLMDVSDEDFYKVKNAGISDSQLYKLAGNSIVTNCLVEIFGELFKGETK